jgi:DNA ligase-1
MGTTFKPLLAANLKSEHKLVWPLIGSAKIDGIRVLIHPTLGPVTRSLKPLPNIFVRTLLDDKRLHGLDGEILVRTPGTNDFSATQSSIMSTSGSPAFVFHVFDDFTNPNDTYQDRLLSADDKVDDFAQDFVVLHDSKIIHNYGELMNFQIDNLDEGFEGTMLRDPNGRYKYGRSTENERILLKVKEFDDAEAEVIGFEYLQRNNNTATTNALGRTERSSHKAGKVEDSFYLGALKVRGLNGVFEDVEFSIGSGFNEEQRLEFARKAKFLEGRIVNYSYQEHGSVDAPRFPIFRGFRHEDDL